MFKVLMSRVDCLIGEDCKVVPRIFFHIIVDETPHSYNWVKCYRPFLVILFHLRRLFEGQILID